MTLEEFQQELAQLPAFPHTRVIVNALGGTRTIDRVSVGGEGVIIEAYGALSDRDRSTYLREQIERRRECTAALLALIDQLLTGKPPLSIPQLRSLRQALIAGDPLPSTPGPKPSRSERMT